MHEAAELKNVIYDNTSGAREIALRSLQILQRAATQSTATTPKELYDELADSTLKILRSKPEMGVVLATLNRFLLDCETRPFDGDLGEFRIAAVSALQDQIRRLETDVARAAEHASTLIQNGDVVLTYSRSSSVLAALKRAKADGKLFDVVTAESRPNLEGRTLARELAEDQIPVRLLVDALLGAAVEGADRVLIGADAITKTTIVNKAGTRLLAMAAKARGIPLHVVADTSKAWLKTTSPSRSLLTGKLKDPKEVWDQAPYGVEIVNAYFEETPIEAAESIVTENGVHAPAEFWNHVTTVGVSRALRDAFGEDVA